jgi:hypothetical protein
MLVFVDDSGDPGFRFDKGSSTHFVIACVIFDDCLDAEETALKIKRLRQSYGWHKNKEFKFNKSNRSVRLDFLRAVNGCQFRVRAVVVDKRKIYSAELKGSKEKFYNYMIKEVLTHSKGRIQNASIRLDGHEDKAYKRAATTYFRRQLNQNSQIMEKLKFVDSKTDNLIQLADMIAGSLYRSTQSKVDSQDYKQAISKHFEDIWYFS